MVGWLVTGLLSVSAVLVALLGADPVVEVMVAVGLAVVAPLALGGWRPWALAALAAAVGMRMEAGWPAMLGGLPALGAAIWSIEHRLRGVNVRSLRSAQQALRSPSTVVGALASVWAGVAAISLLASLAGVDLLGIGEPIVRLTAVHYLYAGVGALTIAERTRTERGRGDPLAWLAVAATAIAPPVVAVGFVLEHPLPQIGGAVVMTVGVWATAVLVLMGTATARGRHRRGLRVVAGLSPWVPMVLAVMWATAQHVTDVPSLSIPDMARLHGLANGLGFVVGGLLATASLRTFSPLAFHRPGRP